MSRSAWGKKEVLIALDNIGINARSKIFIHSNLGPLGKVNSSSANPQQLILDVIEEMVGASGCLILPAFTYSFGKKDIFEPMNAKGIAEMGALSIEAFNRNYMRSIDPMFSLLGYGAKCEEYLRIDSKQSHGPGSSFSKIMDNDFVILNINTGFASTLLHEIEFRNHVSYRYMKNFTGWQITNIRGKVEKLTWKAFVNNEYIHKSQADFSRFNVECRNSDLIKFSKLGSGYISGQTTNDLQVFTKNLLQKDPWILTRKGKPDKN